MNSMNNTNEIKVTVAEFLEKFELVVGDYISKESIGLSPTPDYIETTSMVIGILNNGDMGGNCIVKFPLAWREDDDTTVHNLADTLMLETSYGDMSVKDFKEMTGYGFRWRPSIKNWEVESQEEPEAPALQVTINDNNYDKGMRKAMKEIAVIFNRQFMIDVGYENLPSLIKYEMEKLNPTTATAKRELAAQLMTEASALEEQQRLSNLYDNLPNSWEDLTEEQHQTLKEMFEK